MKVADELKSRIAVENSVRRRKPTGAKQVTAAMKLKRSAILRRTGRAVHGPTKSIADAKAGKPGDGKKVARWKTGPNGGEDQTTNGVRAPGRGADGPAGRTRPSRKSTRGGWAGGEKQSAPLTRRVKNANASPKVRATRGR